MFVRDEWIQASQFHPHSDSEVLQEVVEQVRANNEQAPVVIFDIDSTLYRVTPRTYRILCDWLDSPSARQLDTSLLGAFQSLQKEWVGYSLRDTFARVGLDSHRPDVAPLFEALKDFWAERFFSNHFLHCDEVYDGAAEYVQEVHEAQAHVVYLTGRDEPGMGAGTRRKMQEDNFPTDGERIHFFLKESPVMPDKQHKEQAASAISKVGRVVASFENEPANLVALRQKFPSAMHVFFDSDCSHQPAPCVQGIYRICGFRS